jgi:hypothetical protein
MTSLVGSALTRGLRRSPRELVSTEGAVAFVFMTLVGSGLLVVTGSPWYFLAT